MAEVDAGQVTPVEVVTPAPDAQSVVAPDAPTGQDQANESVQPKTFSEEDMRKTVNDRLTKERRRLEKQVRAEMERDFYKSQLDQQRQPVQQPQGKPKPENFAGQPYENYVEALAEWHAEQRIAKLQESMSKQSAEQQRVRAAEQHDMELAKKLHEGASKYPDFREVAGADDVPVTPAMKAAIGRVKNPADVAYHLGSNVAEAQRIAELPEVDQVWEIRELSTKLSASVLTKTPAPIVPNRGSSSGTKSMLDMNQDEFEKHRKARLARK